MESTKESAWDRVTPSSSASAGATTRSHPSSTPWTITPWRCGGRWPTAGSRSRTSTATCAPAPASIATSTTPRTWPSTCGSTTAGSTAPRSAARRFEFYVQHAAAAIEAGLCDVVLVTYGSDLLSRMGRMLGTSTFSSGWHRVSRARPQYESSWGNVLAGGYAMAARRHMHEFGTTSEQLAEIAVGVREFAGLNPAGAVPRSDHRRRRPQLAHDRRSPCTSSTAA